MQSIRPSLRPVRVALLGLGLLLASSQAAEAKDLSPLADRFQAACQALATSRPRLASGRIEDLELFMQSEIADRTDAPEYAKAYRLYLKDYFPASPLLRLLPPVTDATNPLPEAPSDPEYSRLIKSLYADTLTPNAQGTTQLALSNIAACEAITRWLPEDSWTIKKTLLTQFLQEYPDARVSGWVFYQLAWLEWLEHSGHSQLLVDFWEEHKDHPLAMEANEGLDVPWFSPRHLAWLSSMIPGLGEETLEPGMREASGQIYSEIIMLAGAIGFSLAGQNNSRIGNLSGALIFANLLILNHQSSAEKVYFLAQRRNLAEHQKFIQNRLETPVLGSGVFKPALEGSDPDEPMANEVILSILYQTGSLASGLAATPWFKTEELMNIGLRLEYQRSLVEWEWMSGIRTSIIVAPVFQSFNNQAQARDDSEFTDPLQASEFLTAGELGFLSRVELGTNRMQLRISAGPGWRKQNLQVNQFSYQDQSLALTGTIAVTLGGQSGTYWQIAGFYSDSLHAEIIRIREQMISLPSRSLGLDFGLGIRF